MARSPSLPPEFEPDVLRRRYADLASFSDEALCAHYEEWGRSEGRVASDMVFREAFIDKVRTDGLALEVGPYVNPLLRGPRVRYLDMYPAAKLRERAVSEGIDPSGCPDEIHYVGGLGTCPDQTFDLVFSSHAIEHQPDLIRHLEEVSRVLRPGGRYMTIVPDSRYCFDRSLPLSRLSEVLQAHVECREEHTLGTVIDQCMFMDHNDPIEHWHRRHTPTVRSGSDCIAEAQAAFERAAGEYIDAHAWRFSPRSFRDILTALQEAALISLGIHRIYDTPFGHFEFMATLEKSE